MTKVDHSKNVTLKLWYGGCFKRDEHSLVYMGRTFRTVAIDPDEMGWFTLIEEAEKCGEFKRNVDGIFFLNKTEGLRRAFDDRDAQIICTLAGAQRVVECYLIPEKDVRTSPRFASKQKIPEKSSEKTSPTIEDLQPQQTSVIDFIVLSAN